MHKSRLVFLGLFISLFVLSSATADRLDHAILLDMPDEIALEYFGKIPGSALTAKEYSETALYRLDADTLKVLVVLVEWDNRLNTYSSEVFDSVFFSRDIYPPGSISDYFHEVSYGNAVVTGELFGWYNAGTYSKPYDFVALFSELDPFIDYTQFDGNDDGYVDAIIFVRTGNGQEDSGDANDIWSFAMIYSPGYALGPYDGMYIAQYCTSPETLPLRHPDYPLALSGIDTLNCIKTAAHELTHNFGLPDLYDYDSKLVKATLYTPNDDNDHPYMDWCIMGYGGYGLISIKKRVPVHLASWCKMQMGWIIPDTLDEHLYEDLVIYDIEIHADSSLYMLPIDLSEGEYFLLEYRNPQSASLYDKVDSDFSVFFWPDLTYGADTLERGLLITHVHDSLGAPYWDINCGTPTYPHYTVAVEDAGYNPSFDETYNPEGHVTDSAQWWYPYETRKAAPFTSDVPGQEVLGPDTYPNSDGYYAPTGITVTVDSIIDDKLYASITVDPDGDDLIGDADNCLYDYNPEQLDDDADSVGNVCDNCNRYNPDQADSDGDGIGDVCEIQCGDANADTSINVSDAVFIINYVFVSGSPVPDPIESADVNCDTKINISDAVFIINFVFASGNNPCDLDGDDIPDC